VPKRSGPAHLLLSSEPFRGVWGGAAPRAIRELALRSPLLRLWPSARRPAQHHPGVRGPGARDSPLEQQDGAEALKAVALEE
jgi:hypothetical protein